MFDVSVGPDPDQEPEMACRRPADPIDEIEEPAPLAYPGGTTPPMTVTEYIAWIAENDAHEHAWAEQERAARAQERSASGSDE
ncbi:hypothetical protein [Sphingomonas sp. MMS24-J13]|uniref:hypothetical protein n=1 Tax=Sphingomonas sp. MMS24-J13 TaxID=3238686 RepID=UPI00384C009B